MITENDSVHKVNSKEQDFAVHRQRRERRLQVKVDFKRKVIFSSWSSNALAKKALVCLVRAYTGSGDG